MDASDRHVGAYIYIYINPNTDLKQLLIQEHGPGLPEDRAVEHGAEDAVLDGAAQEVGHEEVARLVADDALLCVWSVVQECVGVGVRQF